jgi:hypothetical protein
MSVCRLDQNTLKKVASVNAKEMKPMTVEARDIGAIAV